MNALSRLVTGLLVVLAFGILSFSTSASAEPASRLIVALGAAVGVIVAWKTGRVNPKRSFTLRFIFAALAGGIVTQFLLGNEGPPRGDSFIGDATTMVFACIIIALPLALVIGFALAATRAATSDMGGRSSSLAGVAFVLSIIAFPFIAKPTFDGPPSGSVGDHVARGLLDKLSRAQDAYFKEHGTPAMNTAQLGPEMNQASWRAGMSFYPGTITITRADSNGWDATAWVGVGNWTCTQSAHRVGTGDDAWYDAAEPKCKRSRAWFAGNYDGPPQLTVSVVPGPYLTGETLYVSVSAWQKKNRALRVDGETSAESSDSSVARVRVEDKGPPPYGVLVAAMAPGAASVRVRFHTANGDVLDSLPIEVVRDTTTPMPGSWYSFDSRRWIDRSRIEHGADGSITIVLKSHDVVSRESGGERYNTSFTTMSFRCNPLAYKQLSYGVSLNGAAPAKMSGDAETAANVKWQPMPSSGSIATRVCEEYGREK